MKLRNFEKVVKIIYTPANYKIYQIAGVVFFLCLSVINTMAKLITYFDGIFRTDRISYEEQLFRRWGCCELPIQIVFHWEWGICKKHWKSLSTYVLWFRIKVFRYSFKSVQLPISPTSHATDMLIKLVAFICWDAKSWTHLPSAAYMSQWSS